MSSDTSSKESPSVLEAAKLALSSSSATEPSDDGTPCLCPTSLFVAWNGVIVLVYDGFPPSLLDVKGHLDRNLPALKPENFGSKWPKTTLAAQRNDKELMSMEQFKCLKDLCQKYSKDISKAKFSIEVTAVSLVEYECRSLEKLRRRVDVSLLPSKNHNASNNDNRRPSPAQQARVHAVMDEWFDVALYLSKVNAPGSRIASYREQNIGGYTCVVFVELPKALQTILDDFQKALEQALPNRYEWLKKNALHCTLRSLDTF